MTSVKYKTHDKKIHWYGNTIHRQWCETLRNIQINENIQKYYLQEIIRPVRLKSDERRNIISHSALLV